MDAGRMIGLDGRQMIGRGCPYRKKRPESEEEEEEEEEENLARLLPRSCA